MKKLFLLTISISLILFVAGISFAAESGSVPKDGTAMEKKVISIEERTNQLVVEGKTECEVIDILTAEGFSKTDILTVLVSVELVASATAAQEIVDGNCEDILGYTAPTVTGGAVPTTPRFVPTPNANAGSFVASPSTF